MLNCLGEGIIKFYGYRNATNDDLLINVDITQHLTAAATARQDLCSRFTLWPCATSPTGSLASQQVGNAMNTRSAL